MSGFFVTNIAKQPAVNISLPLTPLFHMAINETELHFL